MNCGFINKKGTIIIIINSAIIKRISNFFFDFISKGKCNFVKDVWRVLYVPFYIISLIDKCNHNVLIFHRYEVYLQTISTN